MVGIIGIIILLVVMIVLQMPVGFAMAMVGFCGLWYVTGLGSALSMIGTDTWANFSSYGLTVIPLFILMGTVCFHSGVNKNLYDTAYKWFGRTRGGIAMATVMAWAGGGKSTRLNSSHGDHRDLPSFPTRRSSDLFHSGVNKNLYDTAYKWFGRTRGGIAMATVMACAGFAALFGSKNATADTLTRVALPGMKKNI